MKKNESEKTEKKKNKFFAVVLAVKISAVVLILCACGFFAVFSYNKYIAEKIESTHTALTNQVFQVAELTTLKNVYSDIVSIKKSMGMAKSYSIVKYSGVIRVGVEDIRNARISVNKKGTIATIKIPHCQILDNTLVSQEVFDERRSIFVPITTQEIFNEIETAMADFALAAERNGLIKEADAHLVEIIAATVKGFGYEKVEVDFISAD